MRILPPLVRCKAHNKRTGDQCGAARVLGKEVCYHHGGWSPRGKSSATFQHGRYSKDLPTQLATKYHQALADKDRLALVEEIALIDARLSEVLGGLARGESGQVWFDLRDTWAEYTKAQSNGNTAATAAPLARIGTLIQHGLSERYTWMEVLSLIESRRKLSESEQKRLVNMQQTITSERAMILVSALVEVVRKHVTDKHTLTAISADVGRLIDAPVSRGVEYPSEPRGVKSQ